MPLPNDDPEEQVAKDIKNALATLNTGVIILRDCMPPDAWQEGLNFPGKNKLLIYPQKIKDTVFTSLNIYL